MPQIPESDLPESDLAESDLHESCPPESDLREPEGPRAGFAGLGRAGSVVAVDGEADAGDEGAAADRAVGAEIDRYAARIVSALSEQGRTVAVAESLTGGMVSAGLVAVPGASAVLRGGVVAYATALKRDILGVDPALLSAKGPVDPDVAAQMASGVRALTGADYGLATTGVAGPGPADGAPAGRVFIAVAGVWSGRREPAVGQEFHRFDRVRGERVAGCLLDLPGGRAQVRAGATVAVLRLLLDVAL